MNGNGSSTNSMMRNMYHHHHHHQNTSTRQYQYPTTAAAAVMNNAMNGIGRYTAAQMNSMNSMTPYNSMAVQFSSLPNTNNVSNMNLRQVWIFFPYNFS